MDVTCWIVTGWRGAGKTTFCQALIGEARAVGWDVAGILSPGVFKNSVKLAIDAVDIRTGQQMRLAERHRQTETDLEFGDWFFNKHALDWGNRILKSSVPCAMLMIDELGPLEFNLSSGWVNALDVIRQARYLLAVVVIRPELLEHAREVMQPAQIIEINGREQVHERIEQVVPELKRLKRKAS